MWGTLNADIGQEREGREGGKKGGRKMMIWNYG